MLGLVPTSVPGCVGSDASWYLYCNVTTWDIDFICYEHTELPNPAYK